MKKYFAILSLFAAVVFAACHKVGDLPFYDNGTAPVLTASTTTLAPQPADSNSSGLTLSWTNPNYGTDSSHVKYTIEIDSAGKNFARPTSFVVNTSRTRVFTNKELNTMLLNYGYAFNVPVDMDIRVISSYSNNNERHTSNTVRVRMTPYKVPPKVALPSANRLFIVGDATTFGWTNDPAPAFPPARELARLNETTWAGIFYMNGSGAYKLLQTQGDWNTQFHMVPGGNAASGSFVQQNADPGFPSPATAGWYKVVFDFQQGTYTVTPVSNALPQQLYVTGDGTVGGWSNTPPANQQFTRLNSVEYEITMHLDPGKQLKFLSSSGNWQPQFGSNAGNGTLDANYGSGSDPNPISTPATAGNYKIRVNFATNTYTITP